MTNGELIAHLKTLPLDTEIIVASDDEGNGFRPLYYVPSLAWIEKGDGKHGYIECIIADEDIGPEYDADDVERRIVVG